MPKTEFKQYSRLGLAELRCVTQEEVMSRTLDSSISVSPADKENGSPYLSDMIARNPKNHDDMWLVASDYFKQNFQENVQDIGWAVRQLKDGHKVARALDKTIPDVFYTKSHPRDSYTNPTIKDLKNHNKGTLLDLKQDILDWGYLPEEIAEYSTGLARDIRTEELRNTVLQYLVFNPSVVDSMMECPNSCTSKIILDNKFLTIYTEDLGLVDFGLNGIIPTMYSMYNCGTYKGLSTCSVSNTKDSLRYFSIDEISLMNTKDTLTNKQYRVIKNCFKEKHKLKQNIDLANELILCIKFNSEVPDGRLNMYLRHFRGEELLDLLRTCIKGD